MNSINDNNIDAFNIEKFKNETSNSLNSDFIDYIFGKEDLIDSVALMIIAGHRWATERDFNTVPEEFKSKEDWHEAENELRDQYSEKSLDFLLEDLINKQAHVIYLRRIKEWHHEKGDNREKDKWEAKRYIAYLFFDKILHDCIDKGICPDFNINLMDSQIINLLKSLTIEEYCKIKAYLTFLDDRASDEDSAYYKDDYNYLKASEVFKNCFQNCKCRKKANIQGYNSVWKFDDIENIKQAKLRVQDRIGTINEAKLIDFVEKYYPFFNKLIENKHNKEDAIEILNYIYDSDNSKIINVLEFMLKGMISSHIEDSVYDKIRDNAGKPKKRELPSKNELENQERPLWN